MKLSSIFQVLALLSLSNIASADFRISHAEKLDNATELLESRLELTCQEDLGFIEDTKTGSFYEITSADACNQLKVYARLSDQDCGTLIKTETQRVTSVKTECSIETMVSRQK